MKKETLLLRTIQTSTILATIVAVALIVVIYKFSDPSKKESNSITGTSTNAQLQAQKIKRKLVVKNASYRELITTGEQDLFKGNLETALESYRKASEAEPKEVLPYEKIGDIFFLQKRYAEAVDNFNLAEDLNPSNSSLKIKTVRSMLGARKITDAKSKLTEIQPDNQTTLYYKGLIEAFLNDQGLAKDYLKKSIEAGTDENIKKYADKILIVYRDFDLAKDGKIEFLQTMLAQVFDQAGEYGMAIELAYDALKTKYDYRDAWIILGHSFLNEHQWLDAESALTKAVDLDSSHPASFFFRGLAKVNLRKQSEAATDFSEALKLGWQPRILVKQQLADIYFDSKDFEKAFPLYKDIVMTDSSDINFFIRPIALAINHLKLPAEALTLAKKALDTHPNTAMGYNLSGWAKMANNDLRGSYDNLNSAIKLDPELAAAYLNLGQLFTLQGNLPAAQKNYETAIDLATKNGDRSIWDTASEKFNELKSQAQPMDPISPLNTPVFQNIPSLSLE